MTKYLPRTWVVALLVALLALAHLSAADGLEDRHHVFSENVARITRRMKERLTGKTLPDERQEGEIRRPFFPHRRHGNHSQINCTNAAGESVPCPFFPHRRHGNHSQINCTNAAGESVPCPFFPHRRHGNHSRFNHTESEGDRRPSPFFRHHRHGNHTENVEVA